jgi:trk system potassium uptake protein TrkH
MHILIILGGIMNKKMIAYVLGYIMKVEAALMLLPLIVSIYYKEKSGYAFVVAILLLVILGFAISFKKPKNTVIYAKEGFVIVALSWILLSAFGALPFFISGEVTNYIDCFFEAVSGFTTTGSSILKDVEVLSKSLLFWRSFTHWVGGMGVLVFILAIIPLAEGRSMHLMRAEVPGPTVGKLVPKIKNTSMILYGIYLAMTIIQVILLLMGGMPFFDSLLHTFGTAGTGGFGIKNNSVAFYNSAYIDGVITIFMILFGINFNLYYFIIIGQIRQAFKSEELRLYLSVIAISIISITINIVPYYKNVLEAFRYASFQVGSIITTTGYSTANFDLWPEFSKMILLILMFLGACAGSTAGGIKMARLVVMYKSAIHHIKSMLHPRYVNSIHFEGKPVDNDTLKGINNYFILYMLILGMSLLFVSLDGFDFETTFSSVVTCLNNVGPGFGGVGPISNFSELSNFSKLVLSFNMLVGRLEIFPIVLLFAPSIWKRRRA